VPGADDGIPPVDVVCARPAGAPCLDKEKAFILAIMSWFKPPDWPPRDAIGRGGGTTPRRAALTWPRGVDDSVMFPFDPGRYDGSDFAGDVAEGDSGGPGSFSEEGEIGTSSTTGIF
jgi:hypothetical protein